MNLPFTSGADLNKAYESNLTKMLDKVTVEVSDHIEEVLATEEEQKVDFAPPPPKSPAETLQIERQAHQRSVELKQSEIKIREDKILDLEKRIEDHKDDIAVLEEGIERNQKWLDAGSKKSTTKPTKPTKETAQEGESK